ncbi:hypothetical protein Lal_00042505 [Lupinus albus]|nr:hypothetical protein Lal_00042505 [Lupinus albus]
MHSLLFEFDDIESIIKTLAIGWERSPSSQSAAMPSNQMIMNELFSLRGYITNRMDVFHTQNQQIQYELHHLSSRLNSMDVDEDSSEPKTFGNRLPTCYNRLLRDVTPVFRFQSESPKESDTLPDSRFSERVSPGREMPHLGSGTLEDAEGFSRERDLARLGEG